MKGGDLEKDYYIRNLPYVLPESAAPFPTYFDVHVSVYFGEGLLGNTGAEVQTIAVLGQDMSDNTAFVQLAKGHMTCGRR